MVKILYGVQSEGMGHALRSKVIIKHLKKDHELCIVSSGKAYSFLKTYFDNVHEILGFHIEYHNNAVMNKKTFFEFLKKIKISNSVVKQLLKITFDFKPEVIITDFEPFTAHLSYLLSIPLYCQRIPVKSRVLVRD